MAAVPHPLRELQLSSGSAGFLAGSFRDPATILLEALQFIRADMQERGPFLRAFVVDENVRFVKKAGETPFNAEFLCRRPRVVFATGAPAIEEGALRFGARCIFISLLRRPFL